MRNIFRDNIRDALGTLGCCDWAVGFRSLYVGSSVASPFSGGIVHNIDGLTFRKAMLEIFAAVHFVLPGCSRG